MKERIEKLIAHYGRENVHYSFLKGERIMLMVEDKDGKKTSLLNKDDSEAFINAFNIKKR